MELKEKPEGKWDIRSCDLSARCHLGKGEGEGQRGKESKYVNREDRQRAKLYKADRNPFIYNPWSITYREQQKI